MTYLVLMFVLMLMFEFEFESCPQPSLTDPNKKVAELIKEAMMLASLRHPNVTWVRHREGVTAWCSACSMQHWPCG